jgi:hypothetical protein
MKIADVVSNLKTYLEGLTWTSDDGEGTTSFDAVFTYPNYNYADGYPFAIINDNSSTAGFLDNRTLEATPQITIAICSNWSVVDKSSDDLKRKEAILRIREATDTLKVDLAKLSLETTLGVDFISEWTYSDIEVQAQLNLFYRNFTILLNETVERE